MGLGFVGGPDLCQEVDIGIDEGGYSSNPLSPVQLHESLQSEFTLWLLDRSSAFARLTGCGEILLPVLLCGLPAVCLRRMACCCISTMCWLGVLSEPDCKLDCCEYDCRELEVEFRELRRIGIAGVISGLFLFVLGFGRVAGGVEPTSLPGVVHVDEASLRGS